MMDETVNKAVGRGAVIVGISVSRLGESGVERDEIRAAVFGP